MELYSTACWGLQPGPDPALSCLGQEWMLGSHPLVQVPQQSQEWTCVSTQHLKEFAQSTLHTCHILSCPNLCIPLIKEDSGRDGTGHQNQASPFKAKMFFSSNLISLSFHHSQLNNQAMQCRLCERNSQCIIKLIRNGSSLILPSLGVSPQGSPEYCCASLQGSEHSMKEPCIAPTPANTLGKGRCLQHPSTAASKPHICTGIFLFSFT